MKRAVVFLALFCAVFSTPAHAQTEVIERILAVVNDEIVTEQDLITVMSPVTAQYRTMYAGQELEDRLAAARQDFLTKVIEDKLILSEAKRRQVIANDSEVDEMVAEVRNKFPSREVFLSAIEEQGMTEKKLWNRFRDQLLTQKLVGYEVKSKVSVSPGEVSEYYKAHPEEFAQGDRARLEHILIRPASRSVEDAKALAEKIVADARAGQAFGELAKTYSEGSEAKEGGVMGWMEKGEMVGDIDTKIFELEAGGITDPIKSSLGYHIFKVVERQKSSVRPLTEVRDQVQDILFKEKLKKRLDSWLQGLKKDAYISIR